MRVALKNIKIEVERIEKLVDKAKAALENGNDYLTHIEKISEILEKLNKNHIQKLRSSKYSRTFFREPFLRRISSSV